MTKRNKADKVSLCHHGCEPCGCWSVEGMARWRACLSDELGWGCELNGMGAHLLELGLLLVLILLGLLGLALKRLGGELESNEGESLMSSVWDRAVAVPRVGAITHLELEQGF